MQQPGVDSESVGPSGRPQLAPNFMFGQRRNPLNPVPALGEDDVGFQFPQQQQPPQQPSQAFNAEPIRDHRRTVSSAGEITGIMAEQVLS